MKRFLLLNLMLLLMTWGINAQTAITPAGDGSESNPYQIANPGNLYWMTYTYREWNKYFIQTADIDASETSGWWTGGWCPIGDQIFGFFTGFYDGKGHKISGLTIVNTTANDIGFFGRASGATIQNLGITNVKFLATEPYNTAGALLGLASDNVTINNCYSTGAVQGYWFSGGLVGKLSTSSTVRNSYSTCDVNGYNFTGGLIGLCELNVSLVNCFHTEGVVSCEYNTGGLVGYIGQTMIWKCYSAGEVRGSNNVGGLFGSSFESGIHNSFSRCSVTNTSTPISCGGLAGANGSRSSITNCYSTGSVNAGMGGLVGFQSGDAATTNSFWDIQTSGTGSSASGTAKNTGEMLTKSTFTSAGWDFQSIWGINSGCNDGYPSLIPATTTLSSGSDNQTICAGTAITPIVYAVDGLFSGVSLLVEPTSGLSGIFDLKAKTFTISGTPTGAGTYPFTITTSGIMSRCNDATAAGTITVNPSYTPSVTITSSDADNLICPGTSVTFTATPLNFGGGTVSYIWEKNGITVGSDQNTYDVSTLASGDAVSCIITVTDGTCLTKQTATSNTIVTTFHPMIVPSVTISSTDADNIICKGTAVTFRETIHNFNEGTISFSWKKNGVAVGCYYYTYTTTDLADGDKITCEMSVQGIKCLEPQKVTSNTIEMTVNPLPTAVLSSNVADNSVCVGGELTFTASGGTKYEFFVDDVSQGTASTTATFTPGTLTNGQVVTVKVTNANGCSAISDGITTIVNPLPEVSITGNNSPICYDVEAEFYLEGTPGAEVTYSFDGGITTRNVSLSLIGGTATVPRMEAESDVTLSLISIKMNSPGCNQALTSISNVTVNPDPNVSINGSHEDCASTTLTALTDASNPVYAWYKAEGEEPIQVGEGPTLEVTQSGIYGLVVEDEITGCKNFSFISVTINPLPELSIINNTIFVGGTTTLSPTSGGTWTSSNEGVATVTDAGVVTGIAAGTATFTFTDTNTGCSATTEAITITGTPPIFNACPVDQSVNTAAGLCSAVVTYTAAAGGTPEPVVTYEFTGATTGSGSNTGSGAVFNTGETNVTITASNGILPDVTCSFRVTVTDTEVPAITCAPDITKTADLGKCSAAVTVVPPAVTDNCYNNVLPISNTELIKNGNFNAGVANWRDCGNTAEALTEEYYIVPAPPHSSNYAAEVDVEVSLCQEVSGFTLGHKYVLTFKASRRQNNDTPNPVSANVVIDGGALSEVVTRTNTVFDLTPESFEFTATQTTHKLTLTPSTNNISTLGLIVDDISIRSITYPVGTTTLVWTATDVHGNTATCKQDITVTDNEKPVITCPSPAPRYSTDAGLCTKTLSFVATATDNCGVDFIKYYIGTTEIIFPYVFPFGTTNVRAVATDIHGNTDDCNFDVVVDKVTTTLSVSVTLPNPASQQYSDLVTLTANLTPWNCTPCNVTGTVEFWIGSQSMGTASVSNGVANLTAQLCGDFEGETGLKTVSATFTPNGACTAYLGSSGTCTDCFTITPEYACAEYSGVLVASTPNISTDKFVVVLAATVKELTADGNYCDIRKAKVNFYADGKKLNPSPLSVGLVDLNDLTAGTASYEWAGTVPTVGYATYQITIEIVGTYYTGSDCSGPTPVTVSKPMGEFITGGGYLILTSNTKGEKAGDVGSKNNFGFNVKWNKSVKNLQGNINTIIRRTEADGYVHNWQVKGNVMSSLTVNATLKEATFTGKASISDVTDPIGKPGIVIGTGDGNATLQVIMKDVAEPGKDLDLLGITVWNKAGGVWFTSNWNGTKTVWQTIAKGNLQVKPSALRWSEATEQPIIVEKALSGFNLEVYPNPTSGPVNFKFTVPESCKVTLDIYSVTGKLMDRIFDANTAKGVDYTAKLNKPLPEGMYIYRLTYGNKVKTGKVIKTVTDVR